MTSKKVLSKKTVFEYKPVYELPPLSPIATEWNLPDHYYTSEHDPQIEQDAKKYEQKVRSFVKKFQKVDFTASANMLLPVMQAYETLSGAAEANKVLLYFLFRTVKNVNDTDAQRKLNQYDERFKKATNDLIFFTLAIGAIPKDKQRVYLTDPQLQPYRYFLQKTFTHAIHQLTEQEERILSLRETTSREQWAGMTNKLLNNHSLVFKGKTLTVTEAIEQIESFSAIDKGALWSKITDSLMEIGNVAEHEMTAIVTHDKIAAELRGYKRPYTESVISFENNEKSVEALVQAITDKGFALSRRFYKLKAKLHGQTSLPYVNRNDSIGDLPRPDFDTAVTVCRDMFYEMDPGYGSIFDRMLENGHLDVYPKAGKRGGATAYWASGVPTYVHLNHTSTFRAMETLAHEMGHAVHGELSKVQSPLYADATLTTAETASTLFEQQIKRQLLKSLPDSQKTILLHDKLIGDIATIQRQIACFNFVNEMYEHIGAHGMATNQELATMMQTHLQAYLGDAVEVTERDGYSYVCWRHIRRGFYVYTYAYGHLVSNIMLQRYETDPNYLTKINQFLHSGGSDTVENIFNAIGINTRKVETFLTSLQTMEEEIGQLEKLTK